MASTLPSTEFTSSSSQLPRVYDVLINFAGEDIRKKFVSHLDSALSSVGFSTFLHEENAVNEMHIQQPILNLCRIVIVVFTKTYSQSAWCLHQLQQIIKWHQTYSRHVLPVYYEVEPSDVRLQKGDFGKAFKATAQQTFSDDMFGWTNALTKVANLFGWDESNYRSDAELVDAIVKSVLNLPVLSVTKFPVGLLYQVKDVIRTIKNKSTEVCTIGICGMGGSGKTTLAKAIYCEIHGTFTEKSFIEDIAEISHTRGVIYLQEQLFSDVLKTKVEIRSVEMGISMIRERLSGKRVLIVLDDVNEYDLLFDSWESPALFGKGTVIIITAESEYQLNKRRVDFVFRIKPLNEKESFELLSWHAFREAKPKQEYNDLARNVVAYCEGLPLALEVIGSSLFERTKEEWNSLLLKLEEIPPHKFHHHIFRVSFDCLRNQMEKDLFLDICRFFVGKGRAYVTKILNGCGVDADSGIRVLLERNLIKVKMKNKFAMHPLLRKMGIEILLETPRKEPELWFDEYAEYVLTDNTGTNQELYVKLRSARRDRTRLLQPDGYSEYVSTRPRWISLRRFSSKYLSDYFYLHDAITIDLKHSLLRSAWNKFQVLAWLRFLNLSHSKYLTATPDLSGLPSLEQLILKDCPRLREVHQSIGCLCNLILLNLKDCTSLSNLPRGMYKLKSLKTLILSGCPKIDLLEIDIVQMESLITLIAENTAVKQLPFSMISSKSIGYISLHEFEGLSHNLFPSIIRSWMSPTMNPVYYKHSFCVDIDNSWEDIAPLLSSLENLRSVLVQCDTEFQLSEQVTIFLLEHGVNITESGISKHHFRSSLIGVGRYNEFFNTISDSISEVLASSESCDVCLPGDNDPYWLAHMGEGHSVSFTVPGDRDMKGMALCVVYLSTPEIVATECLTSVLVVNYTKCTLQIHKHGSVISFNDEDWQCIISNLGYGDKVEIFVSFGDRLVVKNTAVYLIYGKSNDLEKEPEPKKNSLIRFIKKIVI